MRTLPATLREILDVVYFPLNLRVRSENTRKQYRIAVRNLEEFIGHPATIDDLTDDNVCGMMVKSLDNGLSPATVNDRRIRINALWNWLARKGYVKTFPCNVSVDEPESDPIAWTREEMQRLIAAADQFVEGYDRMRLTAWWLALFAVAWDTGGRTGELLALRWEWMDMQTGLLRVPAAVRKGKKKSAVYKIKVSTLEKLRAIRTGDTGPMFMSGLTTAAYYARYRKLLERAKIPRDRKNGLQKWRRSHATYLELAGGDATKALMHGTATTIESYLDRGILDKPQNHLLFEVGSVE